MEKQDPLNAPKSIAQGIYKETMIETGFYILKFNNKTTENQLFRRDVNADFIQFHFCVKGSGSFGFNNGNYRLPIQESCSLLLYNPQRDLPIEVMVAPNSWVISVLLPNALLGTGPGFLGIQFTTSFLFHEPQFLAPKQLRNC